MDFLIYLLRGCLQKLYLNLKFYDPFLLNKKVMLNHMFKIIGSIFLHVGYD